MKKKRMDKLKLVLNYVHNIISCEEPKHKKNPPITFLDNWSIIEMKGFYLDNDKRIYRALDSETKNSILQIIFIKPVTKRTLKQLLSPISYSGIHQHVVELKELKIIEYEEGKKFGGITELFVKEHKNVEIVPLTEDKALLNKIKKDMKDSAKGLDIFKKWIDREITKANKRPFVQKSTKNLKK